MPFPLNDSHWLDVRSFLDTYTETEPPQAILAPNEFLEFFPGNYPYNVTDLLPARHFDLIVLHKGMLAEINPAFIADMLPRFWLVWVNDVFAVFAKKPPVRLPLPTDPHIQSLLDDIVTTYQQKPALSIHTTCAAIVITRNSPQNLERSLPQLLALDVPILIVDDGSTPENHAIYQQIGDRHQRPVLHTQQGKLNALNLGINYWLANPNIVWISCFQDDVDVHPDLFKALSAIQHPQERPLLSGRDAPEHPTFGEITMGGYGVRLKRSMPGVHLHAHRDYWTAVMPIPTLNRGDRHANSGRSTDEDWWITAWSPQSIVKRGGYGICVPGLVRTFDEVDLLTPWGGIREETSIAPLVSPPATVGVTTQNQPQSPSQLLSAHTSTPVGESDRSTGTRVDPSITSPENMNLNQVKVLVDGYNLQMTSGTGIKTYSTSLIQALHLLGAKVDVLLSRNASKINDVLDEVLFFDNQNRNSNLLLDLADVLKGLVKTSLGPIYQAKRRKKPGDLVIKQGKYSEDFLQYAESFNLPRCYDIANVLFKKLQYTSNFYISEKVDLWHATYPLPIKIRESKKITTIHDLIPLRLPYATLDDKENFYFKVRDAVKESAVIISVSEHSKQDLLTYFDVDPDRVVVTYQPIALERDELEEWEIANFLKRYGLDFRNYILFVGAIEPKKNVGRLLDAYATLDTDMSLVIVGKKGWLWEDEIGKAGYLFDKESKKKVKLLEYVPVKNLKYLYQGAYCLVFPSLYEGFGLPPLEAMTFGCPVITSKTSSLPEVCGNAALYVDPYDVADIKAKLEMLIGDRLLRQQLSEMGKENAAFFSMENYIKRLYGAYIKAL